MLLKGTGRTLIQHTWESAGTASRPVEMWIAADDEEIAAEARRFGANVIMTDPMCPSGTDRVAQSALQLPDADILVNVQGDEPEVSGEAIDLAIRLLEDDPDAVMSTVAAPLRNKEALHNPACVKVVFDQCRRALYFSRSPIPHAREWSDHLLTADPPYYHQHMGLYAYRRDFLFKLAQTPRCDLEKLESLEQLRVLAMGQTILVGVVAKPTTGIDTPEDYRAFVARYRAR
jgi:3-deoxy-manno-octulosonate cytidylyltransferase (CMP-KDO synthetase)